jgi:hypothetical protein
MKPINIVIMTLTLVFGFSSVSLSEAPYHGEGHFFLKSSELEWKPIASMPPGAKMALIEGDISEEAPFTFRLKLPADYQVAPHIHPAYERVTVLSGTFHFAHGEEFERDTTQALKPGDVAIMAPGDPMFGYTEEETVIQLHGTGPWGIEYINPEDDPRK